MLVKPLWASPYGSTTKSKSFQEYSKDSVEDGSDLRIVEVGNNVWQFKFVSLCQLEWVERSSPWNFENNLLLPCRWRKGLTISNISFTHAHFWVQVWGLPFEYMFEDARKNIGSRLGRVLEVDKRSLQAEQAKFMRVRIELPIDKPLRRGGNITNAEGVRCPIIFRYERLPTFCYICGIIGHDEKHCSVSHMESVNERQYGEWLRAGSVVRSGNEKGNGWDDGRSNKVKGDRSSSQHVSMVEISGPSVSSKDDSANVRNSSSELIGKKAVSFETLTKDPISKRSVGDSLNGWDKNDGATHGLLAGQEVRLEENQTNIGLAGGLSKPGENAKSANTLCSSGPCSERFDEPSPNKAINKTNKESHQSRLGLNSGAINEPIFRGKWKKFAREKGKAHEEDLGLKGPAVGNKRRNCMENLLEDEGRAQKKVRNVERCNNSLDFLDEMAVSAKQHR